MMYWRGVLHPTRKASACWHQNGNFTPTVFFSPLKSSATTGNTVLHPIPFMFNQSVRLKLFFLCKKKNIQLFQIIKFGLSDLQLCVDMKHQDQTKLDIIISQNVPFRCFQVLALKLPTFFGTAPTVHNWLVESVRVSFLRHLEKAYIKYCPLSSPEIAECLHVCFHWLGGIDIVTFYESYLRMNIHARCRRAFWLFLQQFC